MKRIKINLALLALVLGVTSAFAFKAPARSNKHFAKQIYGRNSSGIWTLVGSRTEGTGSGQFSCEDATDICRAFFNSQPAQNATPAPGDVVEDNGNYLVH